RGAGLVAVERAMAGGIEPERAVTLPVLQGVRRLAGAAALVAVAARPIILRRRRAQIIAEAEAFIGQRDRAVRIALAGGDAVAETRDQDVAHLDLGRDFLRRDLAARYVDGSDGDLAVANAQIDRLGAVECRLLRAVA